MRLCDIDLLAMLDLLIPNKEEQDPSHINPASIDIRIGRSLIIETEGGFQESPFPAEGIWLQPKEFILCSTWERIAVPNGYAMDLRLKSSAARRGFNHSLAFWVDPGWDGYLTMEIENVLRYNSLFLRPGMRFAQIIVETLTRAARHPYKGRYQGASGVEGAKS